MKSLNNCYNGETNQETNQPTKPNLTKPTKKHTNQSRGKRNCSGKMLPRSDYNYRSIGQTGDIGRGFYIQLESASSYSYIS